MRIRRVAAVVFLAVIPFLTGCSGMSKTAQGAGIGGALGAGTGALIGSATDGKAGKGALIGGAIGAGLGGLIGNEEDRRDKAMMEDRVRQAEDRAAALAAPPTSIDDVIRMSQEKHNDDVIINQIRTTGSTYQLSTEDVRFLSTNGVSNRVIMEMQSRRPENMARRRHIHGPPGPAVLVPAQPVYVLPPPPPPPVGFGVGVHIR